MQIAAAPGGAAGLLVHVHVLESRGDGRGPDECWQIASELSAQSADRCSLLAQGVVTTHVAPNGIYVDIYIYLYMIYTTPCWRRGL